MMNCSRKRAVSLLTGAMALSAIFVPLSAGAVSIPNFPTFPNLPPQIPAIQDMVEAKTGLDVNWSFLPAQTWTNLYLGKPATIQGSTMLGTVPANLTCTVTFPPLKVKCSMSFDL